ncbi:uncharacterized protein LOC131285461 [Anopheles ziemanni]|uniref:uncharacterized protein LOC131266601 n=1 Tax=Anopheles coustani TaxID=139045 RepID=UPI002657CFA7|nr:uncharacterized protein LOC131266601 [Anopheles coustani]XP_058170299.1 uncharacterized protein LOC131285461 [Anopheles ziemanni]
MGCGPSNAAVPVAGEGISTISKLVYPRPEAFEIPLDDDGENAGSLIKKHPPKRLKRLEEQSSSSPSIEDLEEKLATAEIRRQQFLANRSQKTTFDKGSLDATENDASTIPEEGEDDRSAVDEHTLEDAEDSGVERTGPPDGADSPNNTRHRGRKADEQGEDEEDGDGGHNQRRRGSDLSIGHLTSMRMRMNQYRKKSHQH